jgi:hypothetical protein
MEFYFAICPPNEHNLAGGRLWEGGRQVDERLSLRKYFNCVLAPDAGVGPNHRVCRVLRFFSSRRNWNSPTPLAAGVCAPPPPFGPGGGHTSLRERGLGSPNSDEGTYTLV